VSTGIVIPAHNAAGTLSEAIRSVLEQEPPADRLIVVDDGSTDETPAVLEKYRGCFEYLRQPNRGPSAARNTGWRRLDTDAVIFLDADDLLLPGALATRLALLEREGVFWGHTEGFVEEPGGVRRCFSAVYPVQGDGREGRIFPALLCRNFISMSGAIVRREALEQVGGFDEAIRFMEDWDLWLRLAVRFPAAYTSEPTFVQRRRPESLSSNREAMVRSRYRILAKIRDLFPREVAGAGPAARRSVADAYNALGYARAKGKQWREARAYLWTSLRLWPWQRRAWLSLVRGLVARSG
jgi:glycosyltransferase involved in cell wall biosynthesis